MQLLSTCFKFKVYNSRTISYTVLIIKKGMLKMSKTKSQILNMVYIAMFAALICICSLIAIPIGAVPITLQTLGVYLAAGILGWKRGTISVVIYLLLGTIGLPVFSGGKSGFGSLIGPTGGYLIGWIFSAIVIGLIIQVFKSKKFYVLIIAFIVGLAVCYAFGTAWFMIVAGVDIGGALMVCVVPFLIPDAVKIAFAAILVNRLDKVLKI